MTRGVRFWDADFGPLEGGHLFGRYLQCKIKGNGLKIGGHLLGRSFWAGSVIWTRVRFGSLIRGGVYFQKLRHFTPVCIFFTPSWTGQLFFREKRIGTVIFPGRIFYRRISWTDSRFCFKQLGTLPYSLLASSFFSSVPSGRPYWSFSMQTASSFLYWRASFRGYGNTSEELCTSNTVHYLKIQSFC